MIKKNVYLGLFLFAIALTAYDIQRPRILIIGDSISIGYTPFVEDFFSGKAIVSHNPGNAQHTGTGLKNIEEWVGTEMWDIIQFNWGLWDLCYRNPDSQVRGNRDKVNGKITCNLEQYRKNLDSIVTVLEGITDAKLIFVTTTYVPEDEAGRFQGDVPKYNQAAREVMNKHEIVVNDIFEPSKSIHGTYGKGTDDVHFTEEGYKELGELIASFLTTEIKKLQNRY